MLKYRPNRFGPAVCVEELSLTNIQTRNLAKSLEIKREFRVNKHGTWERSDSDHLWTISKTKKQKDSDVHHGSFVVDSPPCFCHLALWLAAGHIKQAAACWFLGNTTHTLGYRAKKIKHVEYSWFKIGVVLMFFQTNYSTLNSPHAAGMSP